MNAPPPRRRSATALVTPAAPARPAAPLLNDDNIGREARSLDSDHSAVRLWLRLLSCSTQIEQLIRSRLRQRFGTTLPRFDYLAQLERHPQGLRMNALSRYLMVSGGNVTGLTDQLVAEGHVERLPDPNDRRSLIVRLTPEGQRHFLTMAREHEAWLVELLAGFDSGDRQQLYETLGRLRVHLVQQALSAEPPAAAPAAALPAAAAHLAGKVVRAARPAAAGARRPTPPIPAPGKDTR